ncbi:hypothetical protein [Hymenobacter pini]|uniref:hypothetical protein n=1 Tax=Hymenobacter pini TaxID=2880879 RepID=UPI001CF4DA1E|nr:hypothetical protein [Hymenobacter pini]MCA8831098.1 hypothetical protein [Hymenobacter pini]
MAEYRVQSTDKRTFALLTDGTMLGQLCYAEWFSFKATLTMPDGTSLRAEPRGFWGTTIEVKEHDAVRLSFKMHWNGSIVLKSRLGEEGRVFVLKNRSVLKNDYVLLSKEGQELLHLQPNFKWRTGNYEYAISSAAEFEQLAAKHMLLLCATHCTNYYLAMLTSSVLLAAT